MQRVLDQMAHRTIAVALRTWREQADVLLRETELLRTVAVRMANMHIVSALVAWREATRVQGQPTHRRVDCIF